MREGTGSRSSRPPGQGQRLHEVAPCLHELSADPTRHGEGPGRRAPGGAPGGPRFDADRRGPPGRAGFRDHPHLAGRRAESASAQDEVRGPVLPRMQRAPAAGYPAAAARGEVPDQASARQCDGIVRRATEQPAARNFRRARAGPPGPWRSAQAVSPAAGPRTPPSATSGNGRWPGSWKTSEPNRERRQAWQNHRGR